MSKHFSGRIVVLQPRRIAALALAQYSAKLHNEPCGKTVGYQFRQDSCKSSDTRILFQTYGNFLQELLHGKMNAEWVIFDEYHERKADMDLLFAYFRRETRVERRESVILSPGTESGINSVGGSKQQWPRIAVMSAALNRAELESALGVKCLELGHPLYPVQIIHQKPASGVNISAGQGIENEVVRALRTLFRNNIWQTTLVFLPGKAEIARCHTAANEAFGANAAEFLELYGGQDRETQDRIFEETERPRVIFTTNIAETSITVPNVTGVVDSGIERVSEYDDSEKVNVLRTLPISMQNAIQRSGRSGRTQNGCAIRLWTEEAEKHMPQGIVPEVLQIEPSELLLQKAALELDERTGKALQTQDERAKIKLPTAIPEAREKTATAMLENFGMLKDGRITELGERAIQTPISNIPLALILAKAERVTDLPDLLLAAMAWIHSGTEFVQKSKVSLNLLTLASDTLTKAINVPREVTFTLRQLKDYRDFIDERRKTRDERRVACPELVEGKDERRQPYKTSDGHDISTQSERATKEATFPTTQLIVQSLLAAFPDRLATPSGSVCKLLNRPTHCSHSRCYARVAEANPNYA